ncbi:hypothetical protein G3O00_16100 [Burkholderia sp. Ac-20384]|uniref:type III secretion protein HrpB4 n=1 Tax=Burkholderia sp. Ac-20384 TaxID=2703902 RepID=UPI00197E26CA|nr:type III secretion protein HrpB4 [Burkholderia sp. Ac-20384]MBN3825130.1 hypothetical protein [Burkholderia sp. Ac-20384]
MNAQDELAGDVTGIGEESGAAVAAGEDFQQPSYEAHATIAARILEHHRCRRKLFEWMHPERLSAIPYAKHLQGRSMGEAAALADAWLVDAGLPVPPLASFVGPAAALAVLPVADCLSLFRLRALLDRVDDVRTWIDRPRRQVLDGWIGSHGRRLLIGPQRLLVAGVTPLGRRPTLSTVDGDALAWSGFRLFERECGWAPDGPLALLQLAMPVLPESAAQQLLSVMPDGSPSWSILAQLPVLFPERSW